MNVDAAIVDEIVGAVMRSFPMPYRLAAWRRSGMNWRPRSRRISFRSKWRKSEQAGLIRIAGWFRTRCCVGQSSLECSNMTNARVFRNFLGPTCILYAYQTSSMPPHGTNYSHRVHIDCPRLIPGYPTNMGAFFALDDITEENGATYFLPGSQIATEAPSEEEFMAHAEQRCAGGFAHHDKPARVASRRRNFTDKPRHALTIGACRSYMRSRFDFPRLIENTGSDILDRLGPVGRRFLGYNVRIPASMQEYYLPPDQRLYLANQG